MAKSRMARRTSVIVGAFLSAVLLLLATACGAEEATPTTAPATPTPTAEAAAPTPTSPPTYVTQGTMNVASPSQTTESMDPRFASMSTWHIQSLYWKLVQANQEGTAVSPDRGIAKSWEASGDNLTWTFHMREGLTFTNGEALTCEDVKFSLPRAWLPDSLVTNNTTFKTWLGENPDNIVCLDDLTVQLNLALPVFWVDIGMTRLFSNWGAIVPKDYIEANGEEVFNTNPVTSGPYKLKELVSGSRITLEAVADHPVIVPRYEIFNYYIVPEQSTRLAMLRTGQVDVVVEISNDQIDKLTSEGFEIISKPVGTGYGLQFDVPYKDPVLSKKDVRRAILLAIDKEALCNAFFGGQCTFESVFRAVATEKDFPRWPYDPETARQLVKENVPSDYTLKFYVGPTRGIEVVQGESIAAMLEEVGFKVQIVPLEYGAWREKWMGDDLGPSIGLFASGSGKQPIPNTFFAWFGTPENYSGRWNCSPEDLPAEMDDLECLDDVMERLNGAKSMEEFNSIRYEIGHIANERAYGIINLLTFTAFAVANGEALPEWGLPLGSNCCPNWAGFITYPGARKE